MEILSRLYRSKKLYVYEDGYGATPCWQYFYRYMLITNYRKLYIFNSIENYEIVGKIIHDKLKPIVSFDDVKTIQNIKYLIENSEEIEYNIIISNLVLEFERTVRVSGQNGNLVNAKRFYRIRFFDAGQIVKLLSYSGQSFEDLLSEEDYERISFESN